MCEWPSEFGEFRLGPVDLEACEFAESQGFCEQRSNIFKMRQDAFGVDISFTTVNLITVEAPAVVQTFRFCG